MEEFFSGFPVSVYVGVIFLILSLFVLFSERELGEGHLVSFVFLLLGCGFFVFSVFENEGVTKEVDQVEQRKESLEKDAEVEIINYYGSQNVEVVTERVKGSYLVEFKNGDFAVVEVVDGEIIEEYVSGEG